MSDVMLAHPKWPSLAQDLAIMTVPGSPITDMSYIYQTYGLNEAALKTVLVIPEFQELFKRELERCKALGDKAATVYRFGSLSQALSEKLFRDAINNEIEAKDAIKLLELLLKASGLNEDKTPQVNTQVNVGVALPLPKGLSNKKLQHLPETMDV